MNFITKCKQILFSPKKRKSKFKRLKVKTIEKNKNRKRKISQDDKIVFEGNQFKIKRCGRNKRNQEKALIIHPAFTDNTEPCVFNSKNYSISIAVPSETKEDLLHTVTLTLKRGDVKLDCNCQRLYLGENSPNRTNCKHVAIILKSFLYNYFVPKRDGMRLAQISIFDIVKFLNQEKLLLVDYNNLDFRSRFNKVYKVLVKTTFLYPDNKARKEINVQCINRNTQPSITKLMFNHGELSAVCNCDKIGPVYKCKHIKHILISLLKQFIFSFKPNKKKKSKMDEYEIKLAKLFANLEI